MSGRWHICRGFRICFDKGEGHCPPRDVRDILIGKINDSDGVIFASPNYSFQESATPPVNSWRQLPGRGM